MKVLPAKGFACEKKRTNIMYGWDSSLTSTSTWHPGHQANNTWKHHNKFYFASLCNALYIWKNTAKIFARWGKMGWSFVMRILKYNVLSCHLIQYWSRLDPNYKIFSMAKGFWILLTHFSQELCEIRFQRFSDPQTLERNRAKFKYKT